MDLYIENSENIKNLGNFLLALQNKILKETFREDNFYKIYGTPYFTNIERYYKLLFFYNDLLNNNNTLKNVFICPIENKFSIDFVGNDPVFINEFNKQYKQSIREDRKTNFNFDTNT